MAIAARAMRQVIVDHARARGAAKRGAGVRHVPFDEHDRAIAGQVEQVLAIDDVLEQLGLEDERLRQVIECRFFAGYSDEETASALGVTSRTVRRDWVRAKAWLRAALDHRPSPSGVAPN